MRLHSLLGATVFAALVLTGACGPQAPLAPMKSRTTLPAEGSTHPGASGTIIHFEGQAVPGSVYSIDVPAFWNGDLVLYAHGNVVPQPHPAPPRGQFPGIRDQLLSRGFAIAATSFPEIGCAEAEAARQMRQIKELFTSRVSPPVRTYLVGLSVGGLVDLELLRGHPGQYAGALTVGSPLGGSQAELQYAGDVRALWDLLMPYKLGGAPTANPAASLPEDGILECIHAHPQSFTMLAAVRREGGLPLAGRDDGERAVSVVSTLGLHWYDMAGGPDPAHGQGPYGNRGTQYVSDLVPAATLGSINAGIARLSAAPGASDPARQPDAPEARLAGPLLSLHARRDPLVPFEHEAMLAARIAGTGSMRLLSQSGYDRFGHTDAFTAADVGRAFDALVNWVRSGVKPASPVALEP